MQTFEQWLIGNEDRLSALWAEYISYMQDSFEHINYVANSDKCFKDFAYDIYEKERTFEKPPQTIAEFKSGKSFIKKKLQSKITKEQK